MPEKYDGNKPSSWAACEWMPKHIRNAITLEKVYALREEIERIRAEHPGKDIKLDLDGEWSWWPKRVERSSAAMDFVCDADGELIWPLVSVDHSKPLDGDYMIYRGKLTPEQIKQLRHRGYDPK